MNFRTIAFGILVMAIFASSALMGEVPHCINYQGYLTDASGEAVADGVYNINFSIYGSPSGTDLLWNSGTRAVQVTDGIFGYMLGSNTPFPADLFVGDTTRYLGITVGADPEMAPRTKLMSSTYTQHAAIADNLVMPATFNGDGHFTGDLTVDGNLNASGLGDITGVTAGSGLSGGGYSGNVSISVPKEGITSSHIQNSSIVDEDISTSADIDPAKIENTAAVWGADNFFNSVNHFYNVFALHDHGPLFIRGAYARWGIEEPDSSGMIFRQYYNDENVYQNRTVMEIGDNGNIGIGGVSDSVKLRIIWNQDTPEVIYGEKISIYNQDDGNIAGLYVNAEHTTEGLAGDCWAIIGRTTSDGLSRYGTCGFAEAQEWNLPTGYSYGIMGTAYDGYRACAIYGHAAFALTNWAGYFDGDCRVDGALDNSKSTMRIDHPSDPENKVLEHATVNAPEMLNVYSGNITTDGNGIAVVQLPDYFESLNEDFRYQLTAIGKPCPNLYIAEEISNSQFKIAGGEPGMKISWQVTGVRKDAFAQAHPVIVESEKIAEEKGYYISPEAFGLDETRSTEYATNPEFRKSIDERSGR